MNLKDEEMEDPNPPQEVNNLQLHKVFVDLSLENDLDEEEMKWFRSKISSRKVESEEEDKQQPDPESRRVEIITAADLEKVKGETSKLFLKLTETNTIWLCSMETSFSQDEVEDSAKVRRENETYEMKKRKKELIRKRCMADSQTPPYVEKSVGTLTAEINVENTVVFASEWDLYDTYNALEKEWDESPSKIFVEFLNPAAKKDSSASGVENLSKEDQVNKIFRSLDFKYASLVTERLLASNCFRSEQSVFKRKFKFRYENEPTSFSYNMEVLWSFQKDWESPLMVTDIDWNPLNKDLLAVAYGDLRFQSRSSGLICIWSPKNPRQPERNFPLDDSVTSLHYSRTRPNILAVGTRTGKVYVLDVSSQTGNVRILGSGNSSPGPIWKVEWVLRKELVLESEELLAVGESGMLTRFSTSKDKETTDILKLNYVTTTKKIHEKKLPKKLLERPSVQDVSFDKKVFSGLCFSIFSNRDFCYVSTKEGVVVKCNLRNPSMSDGIFLAHDGPVYTIEHSPITDLIYFTGGADWKIKIWMDGISRPLITLQNKSPVVCARWSPTIPTVIASIGETEICLWDIAWNVLLPMSSMKIEGCEKPLSTLLFSSNGKSVLVGGQDGLCRVVHLSQLPRIPFLQKEALISGIRRALVKNESEIIGNFQRVVETNKEKLKTEIIV